MNPVAYPPLFLRINTFIRRLSTALGNWLDALFSGVWWWRTHRYLAERRLDQSLEDTGDKSLETRWYTERCERLQFAVMYWRSAPASVRQIARAAYDAGVPLADIRLIVLNTDLRERNGTTILRRSTLARALSAGFATAVGFHWLLIYCLAIAAPGQSWLKALVIVGICAVYATLYRGWSLYAYRALAAIDRSGTEFDRIIANAPNMGTTNVSQMTGQ